MESDAKKLHRLYKRYKVGLVKEEELTEKEKELLITYYGVKINK